MTCFYLFQYYFLCSCTVMEIFTGPRYTYQDELTDLSICTMLLLGEEILMQCSSNANSYYIPENISIKSTLNKIQYITQLILVLNHYYQKLLKFNSILVLFQIKLLNVLNQHKI
jgi:hypothetical protein